MADEAELIIRVVDDEAELMEEPEALAPLDGPAAQPKMDLMPMPELPEAGPASQEPVPVEIAPDVSVGTPAQTAMGLDQAPLQGSEEQEPIQVLGMDGTDVSLQDQLGPGGGEEDCCERLLEAVEGIRDLLTDQDKRGGGKGEKDDKDDKDGGPSITDITMAFANPFMMGPFSGKSGTETIFSGLTKASDTAAGGLKLMGGKAGIAGFALNAITSAVNGAIATFNRMAKELEPYSGELTAASVRSEISDLEMDIKEAQEMGPELAKLVDAQTDIDRNWREIMLPIKKIVADKLAGLLEGMAETLGWIADKLVGSEETQNAVKRGLAGGLEEAGQITHNDEILKLAKDIRDLIRQGSEDELPLNTQLDGLLNQLADDPAKFRPQRIPQGPAVGGGQVFGDGF